MEKIKIIILAAGKGTRMKSDLPKALTKVNGKPMIRWILEAVENSGIDKRPIIVVGYGKEAVMAEFGDAYDYVVQHEQLGTGHAVISAHGPLTDKAQNIIVLPSDHPFISGETIRKLAEKHLESGAEITLATAKLPDFEGWRSSFYQSFSRIVRNEKNEILKDVQFKDATEEEKKITEVNPIYLCFKASFLWDKIKTLGTDNTQKEYYLTDLIRIGMRDGVKIESIHIDPKEALAANSKEELEILEKLV